MVILIYSSCKVPYDPPLKSSSTHNLVVEGYINTNGLTNIKLSRTRIISKGDTAAYINETGAKVLIEDNLNDVYPVYDNGGGNYSSSNFLNSSYKYRLHIITTDNKEYVSSFVPCKIAPPIDNLGWKFINGNVQVFVNTHDPNNNTTFYRWDYVETWEFHSQYYSTVKYDSSSKSVVNRATPVFVCYRTLNSSNIFLGSTVGLQQDEIHESPLQFIPEHDRKIGILYSTLVTQYALDSNAYNYWNAMKSNTEDIGSIFGSQPNQTGGNIHNTTDGSEIVIGYVGAGSTQQARLFISNSDMTGSWNVAPNCTEKYVPNIIDSIVYFFGANTLIPYSTNPPGYPTPTGYFSASATCVDCTLTGTPDKPNFWP